MEIGTEVINISETVDNGAVVLLNDKLFEDNALDADEQLNVINSLFILAYNQLNVDLREVNPETLINISPDPVLHELISMVRMILLEDSEFQLLVYFGKQANPDTKLTAGLLHILEILAVVEGEMF